MDRKLGAGLDLRQSKSHTDESEDATKLVLRRYDTTTVKPLHNDPLRSDYIPP